MQSAAYNYSYFTKIKLDELPKSASEVSADTSVKLTAK